MHVTIVKWYSTGTTTDCKQDLILLLRSFKKITKQNKPLAQHIRRLGSWRWSSNRRNARETKARSRETRTWEVINLINPDPDLASSDNIGPAASDTISSGGWLAEACATSPARSSPFKRQDATENWEFLISVSVRSLDESSGLSPHSRLSDQVVRCVFQGQFWEQNYFWMVVSIWFRWGMFIGLFFHWSAKREVNCLIFELINLATLSSQFFVSFG